jgi:L-threonylcarbamoyladenylate synthase
MIGTDIHYAAHLLKEGKLVAIPTETVYGLAGNALNEQAVAQIFSVKNRPAFDPLIVHTNTIEKVSSFVQEIPFLAFELATSFWAGALTLLLPKNHLIPDLVTSGSPLVAVRIPNHPIALQLLDLLDFPLAAPSANPFGYISPTTAKHVEAQLGNQLAYILDGGDCLLGVESTIVGFEEGIPTIYRKGGVSIEAIEQVVGQVQIKDHSTSNPQAPGMLQSHYAPRIPLILGDIEDLILKNSGKRLGVLSFDKYYLHVPIQHQIILSKQGDLNEAAHHFFAALRQLDSMDIDLIVADLLPERALGRAINDRLRRAAVSCR